MIDITYRSRIKYTTEQKNYMWDPWLKGDGLKDIGLYFDRPSSSIHIQLSPRGGIRPQDPNGPDWLLRLAREKRFLGE